MTRAGVLADVVGRAVVLDGFETSPARAKHGVWISGERGAAISHRDCLTPRQAMVHPRADRLAETLSRF